MGTGPHRCTVKQRQRMASERDQDHKEKTQILRISKMSDDIYESAVTGGLRLKGAKNPGIKKKKKKKKTKAEDIESMASSSTSANTEQEPTESKEKEHVDTRTPAEIAFEKSQEKRGADRILKKASKTHKQRVEELNQYLDGLSEHYDIQKVSWTK